MRINLNVLAALAICAPYGLAQTPSLTTLYSFQGSDGAAPYGALTVSTNGAIYGATSKGGSPANGIVFELSNTSGSWNESVLYNFLGFPNDGATSYSNLVLSKNGVLFGATSAGGYFQSGVVFELKPPGAAGGAWTEHDLYTFTGNLGGALDGANPRAGVVIGAKGVLSGTTSRGGKGYGIAFQLTPPTMPAPAWTETILHQFTGANGDGAFPQGGLVMDKRGALFGTTENGGSGCGCGVVFKLIPPATTGGAWTESILYSFQGASDGAYPQSGLIFDRSGALYGTTYQGGPSGLGTVFRLAPPKAPGGAWTKTTLYSFLDGADGQYPFAGLALGANGALYGTTPYGGTTGNGTVFELAPPASAGGAWTESVLYNFSGGSDGSVPYAGVVFGSDGALYGATTAGGVSGKGTLFQLTL